MPACFMARLVYYSAVAATLLERIVALRTEEGAYGKMSLLRNEAGADQKLVVDGETGYSFLTGKGEKNKNKLASRALTAEGNKDDKDKNGEEKKDGKSSKLGKKPDEKNEKPIKLSSGLFGFPDSSYLSKGKKGDDDNSDTESDDGEKKKTKKNKKSGKSSHLSGKVGKKSKNGDDNEKSKLSDEKKDDKKQKLSDEKGSDKKKKLTEESKDDKKDKKGKSKLSSSEGMKDDKEDDKSRSKGSKLFEHSLDNKFSALVASGDRGDGELGTLETDSINPKIN